MQLIKLKGRLILAAVFLVIAALMALIMGTAILVGFIGGTEANKGINVQLPGCHDIANTAGNTSEADPAAPADVAKEQDEIARTIEQTVKEEGVDGRAVEIVAITGYGESTMTNIGYGDQDTAGTTNADGSKATSFGFLQQQTSMGWGTKDEVMDPAHATRSFLRGAGGNKGLLDIEGWESMEPTEVIHAVQKNADPTHYVQFYDAAYKVLERAGVDTEFSGDTKKAGTTENGGDGEQVDFNDVAAGMCAKAASWDGDLGDGEWTNPCPGCEPVPGSGYQSRGINNVDAGNGGFHYGVDLASPGAGTGDGGPIVAPTDMKVVELYEPDGCAFTVATTDPKLGFGFCHLNQIDVQNGQTVKRGDVIGIEGNKGDSVGGGFITHLHLEIYKPGADMTNWHQHKDNVDPEPILKEKGAWPSEPSDA